MLFYTAFSLENLPPIVALLPFALLAISVITAIVVMNWLSDRQIDTNLQQVASNTNGTVEKDAKGNYTLTGKHVGRPYKVLIKHRTISKNKVLFYHLEVESESKFSLLCVKRYVGSRLEESAGKMIPVLSGDEDFDFVHKILVDNEELGEKLFRNPSVLPAMKEIMGKYTEMRVKDNIELLKRYHVKLTEPAVLLSTIELLSKMALAFENLDPKRNF